MYLIFDKLKSIITYYYLLLKYNTSITSSAHIERLFSAERLIFNNLRRKMSDENFEITLLLKFNKYMRTKYSNNTHDSLCKHNNS